MNFSDQPKIEGHPGFVRDVESHAVLLDDREMISSYRRKALHQMRLNSIEKENRELKDSLDSMMKIVNELKSRLDAAEKNADK